MGERDLEYEALIRDSLELERVRPIVDAAMAWAGASDEIEDIRYGMALRDACRAYEEGT